LILLCYFTDNEADGAVRTDINFDHFDVLDSNK